MHCRKCHVTTQNSVSDWAPRMEIYRKDSEYVVRIDLPGLTQMTFRFIRKGISRRSRVNERPRSRHMTTRKLATATLSERLLCLKAWKRTRLSPDISTGSLKSGCRFRPSLPDGRSRSRSSNRPIGSWNLRPRKLRSAIQTALLRRIEILSANVLRLKHLELIARGP